MVIRRRIRRKQREPLAEVLAVFTEATEAILYQSSPYQGAALDAAKDCV